MPSMQFFVDPSAVKKIKAAIALLDQKGDSRDIALFVEPLLTERMNEFQMALNSPKSSLADRNDIIEQYNRFAQAFYDCVNSPSSVQSHISSYHERKPYYPVGIPENTMPNQPMSYVPLAGAIIGALLLITACSMLAVNPMIGFILLPIAITLLAPSLLALFTPTPVDTAAKKKEEKTLFEAAAQAMEPTPVVEEPREDAYSSDYAYGAV
ncbi:MAG: hypothetical protein P4L65_04605 [Legionella sp.]|nr:hypothetical protein [Legionella sp.]